MDGIIPQDVAAGIVVGLVVLLVVVMWLFDQQDRNWLWGRNNMTWMGYKLIIFDADGTLRYCTVAGQPCPNAPSEWELMPNVKATLAGINWGTPHAGGIAYGVASNQAGVALGYMTEEVAYNLLKDMVVEAFGGWPATGTIQICPHAPDANCECRKPKLLMLQRLMRSWLLTPDETLFVGDMESDKQAAENAGCHFMWAREFFGWDG